MIKNKLTAAIAIVAIVIQAFPLPTQAASLGAKLAGRILLDVEGNGEAWYVNPADNKRHYLGRPDDAFRIMRQLAVGAKDVDLARIATAAKSLPVAGTAFLSSASTTNSFATTSSLSVDSKFAASQSGRILLQVEGSGEAWYVNPPDKQKYYLGRPADAFRIMRELSLGITKEDLALVHKPGTSESIDAYSSYQRMFQKVGEKDFKLDVVTIDLADPDLEIITDTADDKTCKTGCQAKSLAKFAIANRAFAGINATYFCSSAGCARNYYFYPVYNSRLQILVNDDQLKYWTTGPIMAFDTQNKLHYYKDSREFVSVANFEATTGTKLQAALGNRPRLIENYNNLLIDWDLDEKQKTAKATRNAIAYKDNKLYLVVAYDATVPDLAEIMQAMSMQYALNLDGGYSAALFYNGEYMVGPGRNIPNAILFAKKK
jgi:exopolysaccharide biosynthesis protein